MAPKITGYDKPPSPESLPPDVVKKECPFEKDGCFLMRYDVDEGNVKFTTRIVVRNNLTKKELADVLQHERQHWGDFNRRAAALKAAVEKAIKAGQDPALDDRLEWMMYDSCTDSVALHRKLNVIEVTTCDKPSGDRPK